MLVRLRIEEITRKLTTQQYDDGLEERPPSPEPVYDNMGKRVNTREQRQKEQLQMERHKFVTDAIFMSPNFRVIPLPLFPLFFPSCSFPPLFYLF